MLGAHDRGGLIEGNVAFVPGPWRTIAGAGLRGVCLAMSQGRLPALVADIAPGDLRSTAFMLFNLVSGIALLVLILAFSDPGHF